VINGLQYVQERKGELSVLIVRSPDYTDAHERALRRHFESKLAPTTLVDIRYVDRLIRKPNGKFVHLISAFPVATDG
jgi:phenylacetate-CoA ligase